MFVFLDIVIVIFLLLINFGSLLVFDSVYKLIEYISSYLIGLMYFMKMFLGLLFYKSVGWGDDFLE